MILSAPLPSVFSKPPTRYSRPSSTSNQCSPFGCKDTGGTEFFSSAAFAKASAARAASLGAGNTAGIDRAAKLLAATKEEEEGAGATGEDTLPFPIQAAALSNTPSDFSGGVTLRAYSFASWP